MTTHVIGHDVHKIHVGRHETPVLHGQRPAGGGGGAGGEPLHAGAVGVVHGLTELLLKRDHRARKLILRNCPDRVHTILPGLMLMHTLTDKLCRKELYISPYGVREGYLCHKLLNAGT